MQYSRIVTIHELYDLLFVCFEVVAIGQKLMQMFPAVKMNQNIRKVRRPPLYCSPTQGAPLKHIQINQVQSHSVF